MIPKIIFIYFILLLIIIPNWLANIDSIKKIVENPNTNPKAFITALEVFLSFSPTKYDIYIGSIGNKQGEIKLDTTTKNVKI